MLVIIIKTLFVVNAMAVYDVIRNNLGKKKIIFDKKYFKQLFFFALTIFTLHIGFEYHEKISTYASYIWHIGD